MFSLILYLLSFGFNPIIIPKTKVYIHLEQFNTKYNLLHIGISFKNSNKKLRYDYRAFNDDNSCLTTDMDRRNLQQMFPDIYISNDYDNKEYAEYRDIVDNTDSMLSKNIFWGVTNKTFDEIIEYEKTLNIKYKLGIYDCRHYVNKFTDWSLNKPTPIWTLHKLWKESE